MRRLFFAFVIVVVICVYSFNSVGEPVSKVAYLDLTAPVKEGEHDLFSLQVVEYGAERSLLSPHIEVFEEDDWDLSKFLKISEDEFAYLLSLQDENGIIAQTPARDLVIPYFANMAALAMLSREEGFEPVRRYMDWYIAHLNRPDRFKMPGTVYDYRKQGGVWVPTHDYDSADSYAATFISLVLSYTRSVGSTEYAWDNLQNLVDITEVLMRLQDRDGLIWAKPGYKVKFLMDNAENYRGLMDAATLMTYLGRHDLSTRYRQAAEQVEQGIENILWIEDRQVYAWALYGRYWRRVPKHKWYPDTVGQIYPVVFGVLSPDSDRAKHLYAYLNQQYPDWTAGQFDDRFPWTVLGLMATLMDDDVRAMSYLENVVEQMGKHRRGYPWHAFESAFFVKAWNLLGVRHVPAMVTPDEQEGDEDEGEVFELTRTTEPK